jgi:hypothetical protein
MRMRLAIVGLLALFFVLVHTRNALEVELDSQGRIIRPGQVSLASEDVEEWKVPLDVHIMYVYSASSICCLVLTRAMQVEMSRRT